MGIEKFDFECVGMVAESVIDGRREKSCDGMAMTCPSRSIGYAVILAPGSKSSISLFHRWLSVVVTTGVRMVVFVGSV